MRFHNLLRSLNEVFSTAHCHPATDSNNIWCVEGSHVSQSLSQVIRDFLPFPRIQGLCRFCIYATDAVTGDQCLQTIWRAAFTLNCLRVCAAKRDGLVSHLGMSAIFPA